MSQFLSQFDASVRNDIPEDTKVRWSTQNPEEDYCLKCDLAISHIDTGEYKGAYEIYDCLSWEARDELGYWGMSRVLIGLNCFEEAILLLKKGLEEHPQSASLWHNLGNAHHLNKDYRQALKYFEKADLLRPDDPEILLTIGNASYGVGCYDEAHGIFQKLELEHGKTPHITAMLGYCNLATGYPDIAAEYFKELVNTDFETPDIYNGLYWAYSDIGLEADALDLIQVAIRKYPTEDSQLYMDIGHEYFNRGWTEESIDILKKGLEIFSDDEEIKDLLEQIDDQLNDPDNGESPSTVAPILVLLQKEGKQRHA